MTTMVTEPAIKNGEIDWSDFAEHLIAYKGGGYDGCHWEWNYGFVTKQNEFVSIAHSGRKGCSNEEEMNSFMTNRAGPDEKIPSYYLYDVTDEADWNGFVTSHNPNHVINITYALNTGKLKRGIGPTAPAKDIPGLRGEYELTFPCDECGDEVSGAYPAEHQGAGGIAIEATKKLCEDCYWSHKCSYCGEYYADPSDFVEGHCEYCAKEQFSKEYIEEVRSDGTG